MKNLKRSRGRHLTGPGIVESLEKRVEGQMAREVTIADIGALLESAARMLRIEEDGAGHVHGPLGNTEAKKTDIVRDHREGSGRDPQTQIKHEENHTGPAGGKSNPERRNKTERRM
jgi:hypothetical protein